MKARLSVDNSTLPSRVHYFPQQYLRRQDFSDEQAYQVALRRRHNIAQHSWGIVIGLELAVEEGQLLVRPGLAIDGYGRELFLPAKFPISTGEFTRLGSNRLDAWLNYDAVPGSQPPPGYLSCDPSHPDAYYRTDETPRLSLERAPVSRVKPRQPKPVPPALASSPAQLLTPDDPRVLWPVYLGRLTFQPDETDPQKQILIDASDRPYAGVAAEAIDHPANATRVEVGRISNRLDQRTVAGTTITYNKTSPRGFAVFVPPADADPSAATLQLDPRFEIDTSGKNFLRGDTTLHGNLEMAGGAVQFTDPAHVDDNVLRRNPSIYHASVNSNDELRIDLGDLSNKPIFVIGFTAEDGTFRPSLKLTYDIPDASPEPQPIVTVYGDLVLNGLVHSPDIIFRSLSTEALNALISSFQAGVIAAGGN
jgi:hypothetical protein